MNGDHPQELAIAMDMHRQGRIAEAREVYARLLAGDPSNAEVRNCLGAAACQLGRYEEAIGLLEPLVAANPGFGTALNNLAEAYRNESRYAEAESHYLRAIESDGNRPEYFNNYGELLRAMGRFGEASVQYEKAISLKDDYAAAYANLALCRKGGDAAEIRRYEALLERGLAAPARSQIHFALGRFHDAAGDYDAAFAHFQRANELKGVRFNGRGFAAYVQGIIDIFDAEFFAQRGGYGIRGEELPVFIVGMPRSGTSLVEQILASHPAVFGGGELTAVSGISQAIASRQGAYPAGVARMSVTDVHEMAEGLLRQLRKLDSTAARITDKMPMNFFHVGLIRLLFPDARIVHCTRHPLDVALSCYTTDFTSGLPFAYDLRNIGIYYLGYRRLMRHFSSLEGSRILEVSYEELVRDLEAGARGLVEFCGLPWHDGCLSYTENERPVSTASSWQVRQPIYRSSVGRWRGYAESLDELKRMLEFETRESLDT